MSLEEQIKFVEFMRTYHLWFNGDPMFVIYAFLVGCHERLHRLGLGDSNGVDFTTFKLFGPTI